MRAALTGLGEFGHQVQRGAVGDGLLERLEPGNDVIERLEDSFEVSATVLRRVAKRPGSSSTAG